MEGKFFYVPEIGDANAEVVEILCRNGRRFSEGEELIALVTDKASFMLEAAEDGYVEKILVRVGDIVPTGAPLMSYIPETSSAVP